MHISTVTLLQWWKLQVRVGPREIVAKIYRKCRFEPKVYWKQPLYLHKVRERLHIQHPPHTPLWDYTEFVFCHGQKSDIQVEKSRMSLASKFILAVQPNLLRLPTSLGRFSFFTFWWVLLLCFPLCWICSCVLNCRGNISFVAIELLMQDRLFFVVESLPIDSMIVCERHIYLNVVLDFDF